LISRSASDNAKDLYRLEVSKVMYKYNKSTLTIISNSLQMFNRIIRDTLKLGNLHHQKHVQTKVRKCWSTVQWKSGQQFH